MQRSIRPYPFSFLDAHVGESHVDQTDRCWLPAAFFEWQAELAGTQLALRACDLDQRPRSDDHAKDHRNQLLRFTNSQRELFDEFMEQIHLQMVDAPIQRTSHHRLLIGSKGAGKSHLLREIAMACNEIDRVTVLSIDAQVDLQTASQKLQAAVNDKNVSLSSPSSRLIEALRRAHKFMVFMVDEVQAAFENRDIGRSLVKFVHQLACARDNRWMVIVTGSGEYVRSLCFGKLDMCQEGVIKRFPAYQPVLDMNNTKLQPRVLAPIVDPDEFRLFVTRTAWGKHMACRGMEASSSAVQSFTTLVQNFNSDELAKLFIETGGRPRVIIDHVLSTTRQHHSQTYSFSTERLRSKKNGSEFILLLRAIRSMVYRYHGFSQAGCRLMVSTSWCKPIPSEWPALWTAASEIDPTTAERLHPAMLFELEDMGYVRLMWEGDARPLQLLSALPCLQLQAGELQVTLPELYALLQPREMNEHDLAGNVLLRSLQHTWGVARKLTPLNTDGQWCAGNIQCLPSLDLATAASFKWGTLYKETANGRDCLGADGIGFCRFTHELVIVRVQCKVIKTSRRKDFDNMGTFGKAAQKIRVNQDAVKRHCQRLLRPFLGGDRRIRYHTILATTLQPKREEREFWEALGDKGEAPQHTAEIIGRKQLRAHVWSAGIRQIGWPYAK